MKITLEVKLLNSKDIEVQFIYLKAYPTNTNDIEGVNIFGTLIGSNKPVPAQFSNILYLFHNESIKNNPMSRQI